MIINKNYTVILYDVQDQIQCHDITDSKSMELALAKLAISTKKGK